MALTDIPPLGLVVGRELALRQNVVPSRAIPLALTGSLIGAMTKSTWIGPLLTRHLAQREAVPPAPPPPPADTDKPPSQLFSGASPEQELERFGLELKQQIEAAASKAEQAKVAAEAALAAAHEAQQQYTETVKSAHQNFRKICTELEKAFTARSKLVTSTIAEVKASVGEYLDHAEDVAGNSHQKHHRAKKAAKAESPI